MRIAAVWVAFFSRRQRCCRWQGHVDLTGDGEEETTVYDTVGDGKGDALDTTGDGKIDTLLKKL